MRCAIISRHPARSLLMPDKDQDKYIQSQCLFLLCCEHQNNTFFPIRLSRSIPEPERKQDCLKEEETQTGMELSKWVPHSRKPRNNNFHERVERQKRDRAVIVGVSISQTMRRIRFERSRWIDRNRAAIVSATCTRVYTNEKRICVHNRRTHRFTEVSRMYAQRCTGTSNQEVLEAKSQDDICNKSSCFMIKS